MIEKLKEFIKKAGQYAEQKRCGDGHELSFKSEGAAACGIVTEVDKKISSDFKDFAAKNFSDLNYMIIDEESLSEIEGRVFDLCAQTDYQLAIDPIDGTMNYAADIPLYGITIGVLKHGKPWLGIIYAPATDELIYTDGKKVYFECRGDIKEVSAGKTSLSRVVLGHTWKIKLKDRHFAGRLIMHDYFSAIIYCLYLALGRVRGIFMQANLWDIAGGWAIIQQLGMGLYSYENKEEMTAFNPKFFDEKCHVRDLNIGCFQEDFDELKNLTDGLTKEDA